MTEQLASLLLPIDALLSHEDFVLAKDPTSSLTTVFRNMWFICILFHFTSSDDRDQIAMEWQKPALARIAVKTPPIVLEAAHDTIVSDLEYNPVIRKEYVETVILHATPAIEIAHKVLGHQQASGPAHQAYISTLERDTGPFPRSGYFPALHARYEQITSCRWASCVACLVLCQQRPEQERGIESVYGGCCREGRSSRPPSDFCSYYL